MTDNVPRVYDVLRPALAVTKQNVPKAKERSDDAYTLCYVLGGAAVLEPIPAPSSAGAHECAESVHSLFS